MNGKNGQFGQSPRSGSRTQNATLDFPNAYTEVPWEVPSRILRDQARAAPLAKIDANGSSLETQAEKVLIPWTLPPELQKIATSVSREDLLRERLHSYCQENGPRALDQLAAEIKEEVRNGVRATRKAAEQLFRSQLSTLQDLGYPKVVVEVLKLQEPAVITKAITVPEVPLNYGTLLIPFLPVVPFSWFASFSQMEGVRYCGTIGSTQLSNDRFANRTSTINAPYYMFWVENGTATLGKSPAVAEQLFSFQRRLACATTEIISLATHADVLLRHSVLAVGSCARKEKGLVPDITVSDGFVPRLRLLRKWGQQDESYGSPSCIFRMCALPGREPLIISAPG